MSTDRTGKQYRPWWLLPLGNWKSTTLSLKAHRSVAIWWRWGSIRWGWCSVFCSWGTISAGTSVVCRGEEKEEEGEEKEEQASRDQGGDEVDCDVAVGEELAGHVQHLRLHAFVSSKLNKRRCNDRNQSRFIKFALPFLSWHGGL